MTTDAVRLRPRGAVRVFRDGIRTPPVRNLFVDSGYEVLALALGGTDHVIRVMFAQTGGRSVLPDLRGLPGRVIDFAVAAPLILPDANGRRTRVRWTATGVLAGNITYDTLGLMATSGLLVAAVSWPETTALAGEELGAEWTLNLRG